MLNLINSHSIILPITKIEIISTPLTLQELLNLRTSTNLIPYHYIYEYLKLIHSKLDFPLEYKILKDDFILFLKNICYFELELISYVLLLSTFNIEEEIGTTKTVKCNSCGNEFSVSISLKDYLNLENVKIFNDKTRALSKEFIFKTKIKNIDFTVSFSFKSLFDILKFLKPITKENFYYNFNEYNSFFNYKQELLIHLNYFIFGDYKSDNKEEFLEIYENLPVSIKQELDKFFSSSIVSYKPDLYVMLTCPKCNHKIKYKLSATFNLISSYINSIKNPALLSKELENTVDIYEELLILTNENYTSIKELLELPIPILYKLQNKLSKSYEKRQKLLNKEFNKISKLLEYSLKGFKLK